jgi:alanyl-tRNA synthetase
MSGQNCEPLIAELKKLVTVENDQAYKLLQELLSGVTTLQRQLAEVRGELEKERAHSNENAAYAAQQIESVTTERDTLHSQLQQAREERDTEVLAFADGVIALITAEQKIMCSSYSIHRYGINKVCNRLKLFVGDLLKKPLPAAGEKEKGGG